MRNKWLALLLLTVSCATAQDYRIAQPGYRFAFPRDYFNHEDYQTEWWYYTGNVEAADGHRFGFELTFFRQGVSRAENSRSWFVHDLWMAHIALSDITGGAFIVRNGSIDPDPALPAWMPRPGWCGTAIGRRTLQSAKRSCAALLTSLALRCSSGPSHSP